MILCGSCGSPDLDTDPERPERLSGTEIQRVRSPPLTAKKTNAAVAIVAIPMWDTSAQMLSEMVSSGQGCRFLMVLYEDVKFSKTGPVGAMLLPTFP